jgi:hypothetical protein
MLKILVLFVTLCSFSAHLFAEPSELVSLSTQEGIDILEESEYHKDYYKLSLYYETQINQAYCAIASSVMVLNSLNIEKPYSSIYYPHHFFTQSNFFNEKVSKIVREIQVQSIGMTLDQLERVLNVFPINVKKLYGEDLDADLLRNELIEYLEKENHFVIVNYYRDTIGQVGGGHFSPIAAYNKEKDMFLIMDVSRYKYLPFWVKAESLLEGASTKDKDGKRGFLLIKS